MIKLTEGFTRRTQVEVTWLKIDPSNFMEDSYNDHLEKTGTRAQANFLVIRP